MKKIFSLLTILAMTALVFTFSSCDDDNDDNTTIFYKMGFSSFDSSTSSASSTLSEMKVINDAFKSALGVSDNSFKLTGKASSCDKEVKAKCETAAKSLEDETFHSKFTFNVTNENSDKIVYSFSNQK